MLLRKLANGIYYDVDTPARALTIRCVVGVQWAIAMRWLRLVDVEAPKEGRPAVKVWGYPEADGVKDGCTRDRQWFAALPCAADIVDGEYRD